MGRKIKAIDAKTGKPILIDSDKIKQSHLRHSGLPDPLLQRIRAIHAQIKDVYNITLEQFEIGFMRDAHPDNEVAVWERIVVVFVKVAAEFQKVPRQTIFRAVVVYSTGNLTPQEQAIPFVRRIIELTGGK